MMKHAVRALLCAAFLAANAALAHAGSDQEMAARYLQAAQSGDDDAEFYLGALYSAGVGVPASDGEAFRWFSRAAEQGHSHAMLILAGLYAVGRGVGPDKIKAYKWAYVVASASKVEEFRNGARQLMGVLEGKMTPEQINLAKSDAAHWHATPNGGRAAPAPREDSGGAAPGAATASMPLVAATPDPAPPPPAANTRPSPTISILPAPKTDNAVPELRFGKAAKKNDIDSLLDQVPQGLRKRFGF
jgi:hypothetical protein